MCMHLHSCPRSFLHQLLVSPLQGTVTRAEYDHETVHSGDDLGLDMSRAIHELFDNAFTTSERCSGLPRSRVVQLSYLIHLPRDFQAAAPRRMPP